MGRGRVVSTPIFCGRSRKCTRPPDPRPGGQLASTSAGLRPMSRPGAPDELHLTRSPTALVLSFFFQRESLIIVPLLAGWGHFVQEMCVCVPTLVILVAGARPGPAKVRRSEPLLPKEYVPNLLPSKDAKSALCIPQLPFHLKKDINQVGHTW